MRLTGTSPPLLVCGIVTCKRLNSSIDSNKRAKGGKICLKDGRDASVALVVMSVRGFKRQTDCHVIQDNRRQKMEAMRKRVWVHKSLRRAKRPVRELVCQAGACSCGCCSCVSV